MLNTNLNQHRQTTPKANFKLNQKISNLKMWKINNLKFSAN